MQMQTQTKQDTRDGTIFAISTFGLGVTHCKGLYLIAKFKKYFLFFLLKLFFVSLHMINK